MNAQRIIDAALRVAKTSEVRTRIENMQWAHGYAEPGYSDPKRGGVFFADWNDVDHYNGAGFDRDRVVDDDTMGRLGAALETFGAAIEWEDEWSTCPDCGKAVRTSPDSHGWQPAYFMTNDGTVCHNCVASNPEDFLAALEGNEWAAWTLDIDPAEHGYRLLEDGFESGFHPGQNDDPREIAAGLRTHGMSRFVFRLDATGQFDARFSVYVPA